MMIKSDRPSAPLVRTQGNLLARSERRLLTWLCARMPHWVTPDRLTATGVFGAAAMLCGYAASSVNDNWLWLTIAGCGLNWFGDSMDGSLARFRRIERPSFGYFIDHSCDGLATLLILVGLGLSPFVRLDIALICLAGYLLLCIHTFLSARVSGEFKISHLGAGPTELRLLLIVATLAMMLLPTPTVGIGPFSIFDLFFGGVGVLLITLFLLQTVVMGRRLANQEKANICEPGGTRVADPTPIPDYRESGSGAPAAPDGGRKQSYHPAKRDF